MSDMRVPVQCGEQRPISQAQVLLERVCEQNAVSYTSFARPETQTQGPGYRVSSMQQRGIQTCGMVARGTRECILFSQLQSQECNNAHPDKKQIRPHRKEVSGDRTKGIAQSGMERGRNLLQDARQLHQREVCTLSGGIPSYGAQGWVHYGASVVCSASDRKIVTSYRGGTSQGSQSCKQRIEQPAIVCEQSRPQALRASRVATSDLATVTPIHYQGKVWCVRVPTGAFVARRNGKVFITGNSGFPKATRIDQAVDRAAGAIPRVIGKIANPGSTHSRLAMGGGWQEEPDLTEPATPLARAWAGHRYGLQALKPSFEFIAVAQKPYEGKPVDCITSTGAGALNIDQARIGISSDEDLSRPLIEPKGWANSSKLNGTMTDDWKMGRWPSNLCLSHDFECTADVCTESCAVRMVGEQSGESVSSGGFGGRSGAQVYGKYGDDPGAHVGGLGDSGTAARFYFNADYMYERLEQSDPVKYEAKASTSEREAGLDDFASTTVDDGRQKSIDNAYQRGETERRNSHPTLKPVSLCKWLATLLAPPEMYAPRRLLIPFSGSGSEMVGALLSGGWEHITGIEREQEYAEISRARVAWWERQKNRLQTNDPETILEKARVLSNEQLGLFE
jgi:hypothetical protein